MLEIRKLGEQLVHHYSTGKEEEERREGPSASSFLSDRQHSDFTVDVMFDSSVELVTESTDQFRCVEG